MTQDQILNDDDMQAILHSPEPQIIDGREFHLTRTVDVPDTIQFCQFRRCLFRWLGEEGGDIFSVAKAGPERLRLDGCTFKGRTSGSRYQLVTYAE
jgi:hypothetical protein